ncbi:MAG: MFS transporter [Acidobacteriota bacterium]|nr:MFS transporter [Acidobacteriota bacterium]
MSTIVVVKKKDRVAIAADTFSTVGSMRTDSKYIVNNEKILRFGDSYIGIIGATAHAHVFSSILRKYSKKLRFNSVSDIFETYLRLHPILKDEFYLKTDEEDDDEYESSQIEALIANPYGIFGMFSWRDVDEYTRFWAIGSGQDYALGAMYAVYEKIDNPEEIAKIGVAAGCEFDDGSGLPLTSYSIQLSKSKSASQKSQSKPAT